MNTDDLSDMPDWDDERLNFDDEDGEAWKPNPTRVACKALFQKWQEVIFLLKGALLPVLENEEGLDKLLFKDSAQMLLGDTFVVGAKIRSSEAGDMYILRMENAAIIRQLAQGVATGLLLFTEDGSIDKNYIEVVRKEISEFRVLFTEWVKTFEKDEFIDDWGLFI